MGAIKRVKSIDEVLRLTGGYVCSVQGGRGKTGECPGGAVPIVQVLQIGSTGRYIQCRDGKLASRPTFKLLTCGTYIRTYDLPLVEDVPGPGDPSFCRTKYLRRWSSFLSGSHGAKEILHGRHVKPSRLVERL